VDIVTDTGIFQLLGQYQLGNLHQYFLVMCGSHTGTGDDTDNSYRYFIDFCLNPLVSIPLIRELVICYFDIGTSTATGIFPVFCQNQLGNLNSHTFLFLFDVHLNVKEMVASIWKA